jgi:DNA-binding XRE family transcriptional regulator
MARRRAKMTTSQLAKKIDTTSYKIQSCEKGALPEDFKDIFLKLEALLGIHILKHHDNQINFTRKHHNQEKEILAAVREKLNHPEKELEELEELEEDEEKIDITEMKLSKRENLENVTLNDLVDRKRAREKHKLKAKQNEMLGDDLDIDEL